jgi:solute:Na+ symporter, SSS family
MSTSSAALIATATVFSQDIVARLRKRDINAGSEDDRLRNNRIYVAAFGILMIVIACLLQDVVAALTVAYDILVGGLLVPILGGLLWRGAANVGAVAAMAVGTIVTLATMIIVGDIFANGPIYFGLASGLVVFVSGSLLSRPTANEVMAEWHRRSRTERAAPAPVTDATI